MRTKNAPPPTPPPTLREAYTYFIRLIGLIRTYWGGLTKSLLLGLVIGLLGLVTPYISKLYFDQVYPARDFSLLNVLVIGLAAITLASTLMSAARSYYSQIVSARLSTAVGLMYFNHLQHLPIRFFDEHRVGEVLSRLGDVRASLGAVSRVFQTVLVNGVYVILVPPFLLALSWKLAVVALLTTPITTVVTIASSRIMRRYMKRSAEASAELSAIQVEVLSQIRTLKVMAAEGKVFQDARQQAEDLLQTQLKGVGIGTGVGILNSTLRAAGTALYSWYAWTLILKGDISLGGFVAFSAYLGYLTGPVGQMAGMFADFQQTTITLGRAFEYLDVEPEQDPALAYLPAPAIIHRLRGDIRMEHVSFGYAADRDVLQDVSLKFAPGTVTALIGPSGAGKSTVLRMLCRVGVPSAGIIYVDGSPIQQIALSDLRRQVGVVWQEPTLLRGTIGENLTFGLGDVSPAAIDDAIHACQLDSVISVLPEGLDTSVAEWGATVSGGQRQRFAIARALLRNTPVLLLDEATSQVDVKTEEAILRELVLRVRDKTVILVTHRLATASLADRICLLEGGRVTAVGTHDELTRDSATYAQMLQAAQTGDERRRMRMLGVT